MPFEDVDDDDDDDNKDGDDGHDYDGNNSGDDDDDGVGNLKSNFTSFLLLLPALQQSPPIARPRLQRGGLQISSSSACTSS